MEKAICQICREEKDLSEVRPGRAVRGGIREIIKKDFPGWTDTGFICLADLNRYRTDYVQGVLDEEMGSLAEALAETERKVNEYDVLSKNINVEFEQELTFWDRLSDRVAAFGGSWFFIISFGGVILLWIAVNSGLLLTRPFDPYPYIFLNLVLSGLAGFQAPIILMSQNRQDAKDRLRSEHDYRLNLRAELEIRHLHEKMDLLLTQQWRRLLEIQRIQLDLMEELAQQRPPLA